jgi:hypothetical protein
LEVPGYSGACCRGRWATWGNRFWSWHHRWGLACIFSPCLGKHITKINTKLTHVVATQNTGTAITAGTTWKRTDGTDTTTNGGGRRRRCWMNINNLNLI